MARLLDDGARSGQSEALNKGFRRATGDIFAWLNSDDLYLPAAIFRAVQALQANTMFFRRTSGSPRPK
jgi:glycosyltransferase involved in cell wall biosynthesis